VAVLVVMVRTVLLKEVDDNRIGWRAHAASVADEVTDWNQILTSALAGADYSFVTATDVPRPQSPTSNTDR
jgi:hypothetical protein